MLVDRILHLCGSLPPPNTRTAVLPLLVCVGIPPRPPRKRRSVFLVFVGVRVPPTPHARTGPRTSQELASSTAGPGIHSMHWPLRLLKDNILQGAHCCHALAELMRSELIHSGLSNPDPRLKIAINNGSLIQFGYRILTVRGWLVGDKSNDFLTKQFFDGIS